MSTLPRLHDSGNDLPAAEYASLEPLLLRVSLTLKEVIYQHDAEVPHVHFPTTGLISLLTVMAEGDPVEAGTVGRDGLVGLSAILGVEASPHRVICQMAGESLQLPVKPFLRAMGRSPELARLVNRYHAFALHSISQGNACNASHVVEERACRWLLVLHDQSGRDEFPMTHEFLAFMLGSRRQGVSVVARTLQNAGLIRYRRGLIMILDRAALEGASCECYGVIRAYYARFVSQQA